MVKLGDINPIIWDQIIELMETRLQDRDFQGEDIEFQWKKYADHAKLEREILAKYGYFKDIILHPTFQQWKQWFNDHVSWDLQLDDGKTIMPITTIIIILFLLNKRISYDGLVLIGAFLLNLNPIYVVFGSLVYWFLQSSSRKPKQYQNHRIKATSLQSLASSKPIEFSQVDKQIVDSTNSQDTRYDHILIGSDLGTLYTAAILSRVGHRCLVLQPLGGPLMTTPPADDITSVPLINLSTGKPERYQTFLDLVQSSKDPDRVTFHPIGTEKDGFTHTVLRVLGLQSASSTSHNPLQHVIAFTAKQDNLLSTICSMTRLDKSALKIFVDTISSAYQQITQYLVTKVLGNKKDSQVETIEKGQGLKSFMDLTSHDIGDVLDRNIQDPLGYAILNGLSVIGSEEDLSPTIASGSGLAQFIANTEQGFSYPVRGYQGIQQAFIQTIRSIGGEVYQNVPVMNIEIIYDDKKNVSQIAGVQVQVHHATFTSLTFQANRSIISGVGVLATYTRLLSHKYISSETRAKLSSLQESRPKLHIVYVLDGTSDSLELKSTDYYEIGSDINSIKWLTAKALGLSSIDTLTQSSPTPSGNSKESLLVTSYCHISCPFVQDYHEKEKSNQQKIQTIVVEFELNELAVSLKNFHYRENPIGQDSSTTLSTGRIEHFNGPKVYTSNYLDDKTQRQHKQENYLGDEILLSKSQLDRIYSHADQKLFQVYPKTQGNIIRRYHVNPRIGGFRLASTSSKFGVKLSAVTDIEGLYLTGKDISTTGLAGDIQSGWATSNAVLGYSIHELIMGRNIISDLESYPVTY